ncbi:hypothetical protein BDW74DRAFT_125142 [Aspergillus multicolor]|uniref:uncharacterized protein n=1 Tax=Aspergillus multicolor TaxID=41759 RepID=UPI003CCDC756
MPALFLLSHSTRSQILSTFGTMPIPTRSVPGKEIRKQPSTVGRTIPNLKPPATSQSNEETSSKTAPSNTASSTKTAPSTIPTRRQSLIRPSQLQLRTTSSAKPSALPASTKSVGRVPISPTKRDDTARQQNRTPASPKKTDLLPPARPIRSSSLRQPTSSSSGTPTVQRGHARHKSQIVAPAPKALQTPSTTAPTTARSRNHFSAYQQQLSPRKTQFPPPPKPSAPSDQASSLIPSSWPEIAALQTELLQLSLLHIAEQRHNYQWERDAETQLRRKYNSVAGDYRAVLTVEKESQRKLNGQALHYWLRNSGGHNGQQGFAQQVQLLSQISQEVYGLSDSHGRYTVAILEFEGWFQRVEEIQQARTRVGQGGDDFVDPINREWKEETNALIMKLELASRKLQSLDILGYGDVEALDGSALLRTAKGLSDLIDQMTEELSIIRKLEADIVRSANSRVSQLARHLVEMQPREDQAVPRTGLWTRSALKP